MPDPNNVLLHDRKIAFMCIPKAGNTSIKRALMEAYGLEGNPHRVFECGPVPGGYFAVAFVRNPVDRVLSCYADKIQRRWIPSLSRFGMWPDMPLDDFIDRVCTVSDGEATGSGQHFRSQFYDLGNRPDFLGRVDRMGEDWARLRHALTWLPELGHHNQAPHDFKLTGAQKVRLTLRYQNDWQYLQS